MTSTPKPKTRTILTRLIPFIGLFFILLSLALLAAPFAEGKNSSISGFTAAFGGQVDLGSGLLKWHLASVPGVTTIFIFLLLGIIAFLLTFIPGLPGKPLFIFLSVAILLLTSILIFTSKAMIAEAILRQDQSIKPVLRLGSGAITSALFTLSGALMLSVRIVFLK